jgi:hypothetical protein
VKVSRGSIKMSFRSGIFRFMLKRTFYESFENIFKASLEIIFTGKL